MPLPLGHTAIGWAAYETAHKPETCGSRIGLFMFIAVLANLPDLDFLFGLLAGGNASAFHRGPTHSLIFALLAGFLAARAGRLWRRIPQLGFGLCALVVFSHVAADMLLTAAPVSLLWPFEIHWSAGYSGWNQVIRMALFQSVQDIVIAAVALMYLCGLRLLRKEVCLSSGLLAFARRLSK